MSACVYWVCFCHNVSARFLYFACQLANEIGNSHVQEFCKITEASRQDFSKINIVDTAFIFQVKLPACLVCPIRSLSDWVAECLVNVCFAVIQLSVGTQ